MPSVVRVALSLCAFAAPVTLLASDLALVTYRSTPGLVLQRVALVLFMVALVGVAAGAANPRRVLVIAGCALAIAGAAIIVLRPEMLAAPLRVPAALFPIGLLVTAVARLGSRPSSRSAALLAIGAILFPLGHVSGSAAALVVSDVAFFVSLGPLAHPSTDRIDLR